MITIEQTEVCGFDAAIRGMRNAHESWDKIDSYPYIQNGKVYEFIGENDRKLMRKLAAAGDDHGKFMRMITVSCDITAPLYWWKEYDTYKVGTVANSCSTMHKVHAHEFTLDMFSTEHLLNWTNVTEEDRNVDDNDDGFDIFPLDALALTIDVLNSARELYLKTNDKKYWWQMIQLLPSSYNQKRTVQLNYQVLKNIYHARRNHKLDEWHEFCDWIKTLLESELITGEDEPRNT